MKYTTAFFLLFASLMYPSLSIAASPSEDPFASIEHIKYDNGFELFLAPSDQATNTAVHLEVLVGWEAENSKNWGVSHLLEHTLFRDKQLKEEMTYLQLIREAGGEANGSTNSRVTTYFGSIPQKKGTWLLESITKMILEPTIADEYVEKEKGTVELERGQPSPIVAALGFNPLDYIYPKYLKIDDFWKSEFGISKDMPFTLSEEQLSTRRLTTEQVKKYYEEFYYASNMRLYVAGKFNRADILKIVNSKWASLPKKVGSQLTQLPKIHPNPNPFIRKTLMGESPYVYIGTKDWDVSVKENAIITSYMGYLAHSVMKEIRNLKGQTYSANSYTDNREGYGFSYVTFQTKKENLAENLEVLNHHIYEEAEKGQFPPEKVKEATDLYLGDFLRSEKEARQMMDYATTYGDIVSVYGKFDSPYASLENISAAEYNAALRKHFKPEQRYQYIYEPYYFFHYDMYVLYFFVALATFLGMKSVMTKEFHHAKLQWVRKVKFPPFKILELLTLLIAWVAFTHIQYGLHLIFDTSMMQQHVLLGQYLYFSVWAFCLLSVALGAVAILPSKLMIMDQQLVIKSVSYYSKHIPYSDVLRVEKVRPFSKSFWKLFFGAGINFRFYYFNPKFWQPGVAFYLKNKRVLFFSVSDAAAVVNEFNGLAMNEYRESVAA